MRSTLIPLILFCFIVIYASARFIGPQANQHVGFPQGPQHWPQHGNHWNDQQWNGFQFPTQPNNLNGQWQLPENYRPDQHGHFNPWGKYYYKPGMSFPTFNMADKYAYNYFQRNGFSAESAIVFCTNSYIEHIVRSSQSLINFCDKIKEEYGNENIPTYPKTPQNSQ